MAERFVHVEVVEAMQYTVANCVALHEWLGFEHDDSECSKDAIIEGIGHGLAAVHGNYVALDSFGEWRVIDQVDLEFDYGKLPLEVPEPMSTVTLDYIEALLPRGGFWASTKESDGHGHGAPGGDEPYCIVNLEEDDPPIAQGIGRAEDADAIVTALNAAPKLVAQIRRLNKILDALERGVEGACG